MAIKKPCADDNKDKDKKSSRNDQRRKMTYKEKMEFEQLSKDIEQLEAEQKQIEDALCSGTLTVEQITELSRRLPEVKDALDEKGMRWLELSEFSAEINLIHTIYMMTSNKNKMYKMKHSKATVVMRWLLTFFMLFFIMLPSSAVLKEKNLDNTLSILRSELTNYYNDLQRQISFMKDQQ